MGKTRILDGKQIARQIKTQLVPRIQELREQDITPGLAAILVGYNPASQLYVRTKTQTCADLGMYSEKVELPEKTTTEELLEVIDRLNRTDQIDGILVQLPLPKHIDEEVVLSTIDLEKDIDGFHPINVGKLCGGKAVLAPCTPMGILEMLQREGVVLKGAEAVVVGRSTIVGRPMALLLLHEHATVTICHSRTQNLPAVCHRADVLIVAVGRPAIVTQEYIKEGAVVVDVGINKVENRQEVIRLFGEGSERLVQFEKRGYTLVGDVHPRDPFNVAAAITPVPGGVGPLTIAQLMKNTVSACRLRRGQKEVAGSSNSW